MAKHRAAHKAKGGKKSTKRSFERSVYDLPVAPRSRTKPPAKPDTPKLERQLDEGLENTFPASDPPAMSEPAPTPPGNGRTSG